MVELRRNIKCSGCGTESSIILSANLALTEILIHGRCESCGNSMQLNYSLIETNQGNKADQQNTEQKDESGMVNIEESLIEPDLGSETIKDLIEG